MSKIAKFLRGREKPVMRREKIYVSILAGDANNHARLTEFLLWIQGLSHGGGIDADFEFGFRHENSPVEWARNLAVRDFLATDCDRIWFIDTDQVPEAATLLCLTVDADISCGWTLIHTRDAEDQRLPQLVPNIFRCSDDGRGGAFKPIADIADPKAIIPVDAAGTAIMVIRREVLADKRMWLPTEYVDFDGQPRDLANDDDPGVPIFRRLQRPDGRYFRGEDVDFCWRAKALGYSVKAHMGAKADHWKPTGLLSIGHYVAKMVARHDAQQKEAAR